MKIKMDLLPATYKCVRKDYLGILLLVVSIIGALAGNFVFDLVKKQQIVELQKKSEQPAKDLDREIRTAKAEKARLEKEYSDNVFPESEKVKLAERCEKFNRMKKEFSWYEFFEVMEHVTPNMIWIKDIYTDEIPKVLLCCESDKSLTAISFYRSLLHGKYSKYFENVVMGVLIFDVKTYSIKFTMSFVFKPSKTHAEKGEKGGES